MSSLRFSQPAEIKIRQRQEATPALAHFAFCNPQCNCDIFVASPPGQSDSLSRQ
jgi:hypothetical protein